jgi:2-polyprenyl-3-methyl-5-hydroxy-6-metoxy-1,4-benzoquinol methylase
MKNFFLSLLSCPKSASPIKIKKKKNGKSFLISKLGNKFKIKNKIIRFENNKNYSKNFGHQWQKFSKTQLDSFNGTKISEDRFFLATGWNKNEIKNKLVLDVGCGSGRFTEVALKYGAKVVAIDYSEAVDVAQKNLGKYKNALFIQSNIYSLPFKKKKFDFVFCLGVLQHTPNVEKAFKCLPDLLKKNGKICVDYYWKRPKTLLNSKYFFRPLTKKIPNEKLFKIIKFIFPFFYGISNLISLLPYGIYLRRLLPISNYNGIYKLSNQQQYEWALLDTYDMLAPTYDNPQTKKDVIEWMKDSSMKKIECLHAGHLVVRGVKL